MKEVVFITLHVNIIKAYKLTYVFHRVGRHRVHVQGRTGADVTIRGLTDPCYLPVQHLKGHLTGCYSSLMNGCLFYFVT